jgi:hypothetical protein
MVQACLNPSLVLHVHLCITCAHVPCCYARVCGVVQAAPRVNHQMLKDFVGRTVSLVGKVESRGQVWRLQAADGLPVNVTVLEDAKPIDKPDGTSKADDTCVGFLNGDGSAPPPPFCRLVFPLFLPRIRVLLLGVLVG